MATSEERRALAERLRRASACGEGISCCVVDKALGLRYDDDYFGDVFTCESVRDLADLIDPTCHKVIPSEIEGYVFCSKCGAEIGEYGVPNYCHNCGARVASGGEG